MDDILFQILRCVSSDTPRERPGSQSFPRLDFSFTPFPSPKLNTDEGSQWTNEDWGMRRDLALATNPFGSQRADFSSSDTTPPTSNRVCVPIPRFLRHTVTGTSEGRSQLDRNFPLGSTENEQQRNQGTSFKGPCQTFSLDVTVVPTAVWWEMSRIHLQILNCWGNYRSELTICHLGKQLPNCILNWVFADVFNTCKREGHSESWPRASLSH